MFQDSRQLTQVRVWQKESPGGGAVKATALRDPAQTDAKKIGIALKCHGWDRGTMHNKERQLKKRFHP